jgi:hypothetical protein
MSLPVVKDNRITGRNSKNKSTVKLEVIYGASCIIKNVDVEN